MKFPIFTNFHELRVNIIVWAIEFINIDFLATLNNSMTKLNVWRHVILLLCPITRMNLHFYRAESCVFVWKKLVNRICTKFIRIQLLLLYLIKVYIGHGTSKQEVDTLVNWSAYPISINSDEKFPYFAWEKFKELRQKHMYIWKDSIKIYSLKT